MSSDLHAAEQKVLAEHWRKFDAAPDDKARELVWAETERMLDGLAEAADHDLRMGGGDSVLEEEFFGRKTA